MRGRFGICTVVNEGRNIWREASYIARFVEVLASDGPSFWAWCLSWLLAVENNA